MNATETQQQPTLKENEKKWTKPLMDAGYTVIPDVILDRQQALGLDPVDVNILLQLLTYWWKADNLPYPSKKSIAERIEKTVQRRIARMERDGLMKRIPRRSAAKGQLSNIYDFSGLITAVTPFANEAVERKTAIQTEAKTRAKRKRPSKQKFQVLPGGEGGSE